MKTLTVASDTRHEPPERAPRMSRSETESRERFARDFCGAADLATFLSGSEALTHLVKLCVETDFFAAHFAGAEHFFGAAFFAHAALAIPPFTYELDFGGAKLYIGSGRGFIGIPGLKHFATGLPDVGSLGGRYDRALGAKIWTGDDPEEPYPQTASSKLL